NAGKLALGLVRKTQADQNAGKLALGLVRKTQADQCGRSPRLKWPEEIRQVTTFNYSSYKLPNGTINVGRITPPR
ncbi:hypothetical protein, partial [Burkholderia gladioli]|uniref:hypothetical protein n=1 Tax=Burkholderia gladioli TaxID=28095 RepID=UPI001C5CE6FC